jgi:rhodanese-related sulfurtransferase
MPQTITRGYKALLDDANAKIETLTPQDVMALQGRGDVVFVDIRDPRELEREGRMPGAIHCPRGMLEFWIDPESPYHKPVFAEDKRFVFFCAGGWRGLRRHLHRGVARVALGGGRRPPGSLGRGRRQPLRGRRRHHPARPPRGVSGRV